MAVRTSTEIIAGIREALGESTVDSAITLLEDVSDTLNDYDNRLSEDWKSKYEENDKQWRERYAQRFYEPGTVPPDAPDNTAPEPEPTPPVIKTYDDLFEEIK